MASRPTSDFQYEYPPEAIAQRPLEDRAASRMLLVDRATGGLRHLHIRDLPTLIEPGDAIVVNTSRVIPARLTGTRENGREAELLLIHAEDDGSWLAMVHPGGKLKTGRTIRFGSDTRATVTEVMRGGLRRVRFSGGVDPRALMDLYGETPLPPYIHRKPDARDVDRYQTVFAKVEGSVAAPTAGLHFTDELLDAIRERGARIADIVLHVGPGTFKPVETDNPTEHPMHPEWYEVPTAAAEIIEQAKASGCRVWGIGTTAVRTLETTGGRAASGWTDLFIYPPYTFTVVDAMLTNFHLPRSTLLMLVAAFAGFEPTMNAYRSAVADGYRLYSYGDAMAIV